MRLIDADLLMRKCEKWLKPKAPDEDEMVSVADIAVSTLMEIEEQPTAFDVEKVVALLEEELKLADDEKARCIKENPIQFDSAKGYANGIANAIDCVKGGLMPGENVREKSVDFRKREAAEVRSARSSSLAGTISRRCRVRSGKVDRLIGYGAPWEVLVQAWVRISSAPEVYGRSWQSCRI